jgi:hypothetical protein
MKEKIIAAISNVIFQVSLKRGSAKSLIPYIADDFADLIQDFQDYM